MVRLALTFPGVARLITPEKADYEPSSVPSNPEDGLTGQLETLCVRENGVTRLK